MLFDQGRMVEVEPGAKAWGWPAELKRTQYPTAEFAYRFKLHLAGDVGEDIPPLPAGVSAVDAIAAYLREMKDFIMLNIAKQIGDHITLSDIQWCLTVPAIWQEGAKSAMQVAAEKAGMVQGPHGTLGVGSTHELLIVLEPEAAALYSFYHIGAANINQ